MSHVLLKSPLTVNLKILAERLDLHPKGTYNQTQFHFLVPCHIIFRPRDHRSEMLFPLVSLHTAYRRTDEDNDGDVVNGIKMREGEGESEPVSIS